MTRKEQNKILNDKIVANNAQYNLDRMNAEISAYSSGDLPKYEYLTKKDLNYKPNAFEQAKFEYSPLGKVFIDRLDKSDRKKGLLKRLKNIEDKSNNQLLAFRDINRPPIRGRNNDGYKSSDDGDDDYDDDYKIIKAIEGNCKDKDDLDKNVDEDFNDMARRTINLDGKTYIIGRNESIYAREFKNNYKKIIDDYTNKKIKRRDILDELNKVNKGIKIYQKNKDIYKNIPNIEDQIINSKKFDEGLNKTIKLIDSNRIRIGKDFAEASTISIPWMNDWELYKQINEDFFARYRKGKDSFELLSIKTFLDNINNKKNIKNKKDARKKFKTIKKNVKSKALRTIVKALEQAIFGNDDSNGESSKDDKKRTFAPSSPPREDYSAETYEYLKYLEEQEKGRKKISDEYDRNG